MTETKTVERDMSVFTKQTMKNVLVKAIQNMRSEHLNRGRLAEGEVLQDESLMASGEQPNQPKPAE